MKKVAVLGAGGFIGSHLVKYLKSKKYFVMGGAESCLPSASNLGEEDRSRIQSTFIQIST
jgi:nucleoside-diphosphate-sugar epimerase